MRGAYPRAEENLVRMLDAIHARMLDDGDGGGRSGPLKLGPGDLARMGTGVGLDEAETAELFRDLVRGNYVRLRGRYREGVTGRSAPAHVAGLTDRGLRELRRDAGSQRDGPVP
ncbi:hypothetical protein GBA65_01565 [Rubrobacter marinus]|uniref:Uncharacterized protein n=1 Tax=Rubrobacter marinus TaxID=2653852 RepID=A0A6G8PSK0_9ACTN|nr:hypothetical protein [Rubrobacter marinus]QIN77410.1 hypothetical protein GBA65_01565 [Rubrobacter marinus]